MVGLLKSRGLHGTRSKGRSRRMKSRVKSTVEELGVEVKASLLHGDDTQGNCGTQRGY